MKTTKKRLMELAGLLNEDDFRYRTIEELMDMAKDLRGYKKLSDTKFQIQSGKSLASPITQVESIPGKPSRMSIKIGSEPSREIHPSSVYNIIYNKLQDEEFSNDRLGSKSLKNATKPAKGVRVRDDEGEAITTLTDVTSQADLMSRIEKEPKDYQAVWADIPYAFDVVGPDSMYKTTDADVEDLEHYPPTTYQKWIKGYRDWAKEVLSGQ